MSEIVQGNQDNCPKAKILSNSSEHSIPFQFCLFFFPFLPQVSSVISKLRLCFNVHSTRFRHIQIHFECVVCLRSITESRHLDRLSDWRLYIANFGKIDTRCAYQIMILSNLRVNALDGSQGVYFMPYILRNRCLAPLQKPTGSSPMSTSGRFLEGRETAVSQNVRPKINIVTHQAH